jgi:hypothetical protein
LNPRDDEYIYATVSFLKQRYQTGAIPAQSEVLFTEEESSFLFDFAHEE